MLRIFLISTPRHVITNKVLDITTVLISVHFTPKVCLFDIFHGEDRHIIMFRNSTVLKIYDLTLTDTWHQPITGSVTSLYQSFTHHFEITIADRNFETYALIPESYYDKIGETWCLRLIDNDHMVLLTYCYDCNSLCTVYSALLSPTCLQAGDTVFACVCLSVCLFVCLSVCPSVCYQHISRTGGHISISFYSNGPLYKGKN